MLVSAYLIVPHNHHRILLSLLLTCLSCHPNESKQFVDCLAQMGFVLSTRYQINQTPQDRLSIRDTKDGTEMSKTQHHNRIDKMHM